MPKGMVTATVQSARCPLPRVMIPAIRQQDATDIHE
jgi:hypothetical protein